MNYVLIIDYLRTRTQIATIVYANRVPMDIMSISCCRSKMVAIIPAKTTQMDLLHLVLQDPYFI
jgi:hypothetical protein